MIDDLEVRVVTRDGRRVFQLRCPSCLTWEDLDDDQLHGRVSIECDVEGCSFHETANLAPAFAAAGLL